MIPSDEYDLCLESGRRALPWRTFKIELASMSWTFVISTGQLSHDGMPVAVCYSGRGVGKNNPVCCSAQMGTLGADNFGPLPIGKYTIAASEEDPRLGPIAMRLSPDPANQMHGRAGFFIHADSVAHPGEASEGCIVPMHGSAGESGHQIRMMISASADRELEVDA